MTDNIGATFRYRQRVREAFENYKRLRQYIWDGSDKDFTSESIKAQFESAWRFLKLELRWASQELERDRHELLELRAA